MNTELHLDLDIFLKQQNYSMFLATFSYVLKHIGLHFGRFFTKLSLHPGCLYVMLRLNFQGNKEYQKKQNDEALSSYSQALQFATNSSEAMALAYANR
jgi:hypothetical protein